MSGKSGNPGTPSDECCVLILHFLTFNMISFIELLYKLGWSLCSGGMTKDASFSWVMGLGPTDKFDVTCASSSSTDDFSEGVPPSIPLMCLFMMFRVGLLDDIFT